MNVVAIYSGGLDSTVLLYHLRSQGHMLRALGIDYGQRHRRELDAARAMAEPLGIEYRIVDLSSLRPLLAGSSQTSSDVAVPEGHYTEESMKRTVVPNRNMIMLSIAIGWAVSLRYDAVAYAAHGGDHTIYPDCRPAFVEAMNRVAGLCDWHAVRVISPFAEKTKTDLVRIGAELDVPFALTWSCYKGGERHCGRCGTCVERREAFTQAGVYDPTDYEL
jgi:7-cyano-7-deazaguanine synthase